LCVAIAPFGHHVAARRFVDAGADETRGSTGPRSPPEPEPVSNATMALTAVLVAFSLVGWAGARRFRDRRGLVEIFPTPLSRPGRIARATPRNDERFVEDVWADVARRWAMSWESRTTAIVSHGLCETPSANIGQNI
jgi:hypothetical protein